MQGPEPTIIDAEEVEDVEQKNNTKGSGEDPSGDVKKEVE